MNQTTAGKLQTPSASNAALRGVLIAALVLVAGAGAWWWSNQRAAPEPVVVQAVPVVASPVAAAADPYQRVRAQIAADQIVQPPGDNAIESYLELLAERPDDSGARQALTELLPFASRVADQAAAAGNDVELLRLVGLIERADPGYAQLPALRARAARIDQTRTEEIERELQVQREALAARAAAARPQPPAPAAAVSPERVTATPPASAAAPQSQPATTTVAVPPPAPTAAAAPPPTQSAPAAAQLPPPARLPAAEARISEAEQINSIAPQYPQQALARRQEGWVDVELLVDVRGMPREVNVVGAQPARVFDREAVRAANRWRFRPRSVDGNPVESRIKRRINFRLPD